MEQAVLLLAVAAPAGGDHVLPDVETATGAGHHVVDVLGSLAAVLAGVVIAHEHRSTGEPGPGSERHLHKVPEPDDAWGLDLEGGPADQAVAGHEDIGL